MNSADLAIHLIPDTNLIIDGFKHREPIDTSLSHKNIYILTHFHADHYNGLTKRWDYGPIFCSEITAKLVQWKFNIPDDKLRIVHEGEEVRPLPDVCLNLSFRMVSANHCPGSMMVLVNHEDKTYLHTGDFRFHPPAVLKSSVLHDYLKPECYSWIPEACQVQDTTSLKQLSFDKVFLDTTYCHPKSIFPHQQHAMDFVAEVCKMKIDHAKKNNKKVIVIVGSYTIGKERIVKAIAERCQCKVFAKFTKLQILQLLKLPYQDIFVGQSNDAPIHFVDMKDLHWKRINEVVKFHQDSVDEFLVIKPSAMMREANPPPPGHCKVKRSKKITTICVPYSEHSSFHELRKFMECFNVKEVVPTVYSNKDHYLRQVQYLTELDFNVPELGAIPIPDTLRPEGSAKPLRKKGTLFNFFTPRKTDTEKKVEKDTPQEGSSMEIDDMWSVNSGGDGSLNFSLDTPLSAGGSMSGFDSPVGEDIFKTPRSTVKKTPPAPPKESEIVDLTEIDVDEQLEILTMIEKKKSTTKGTTTKKTTKAAAKTKTSTKTTSSSTATKVTSTTTTKTSTTKKKFKIAQKTIATSAVSTSTTSSSSTTTQLSSKKRKAIQEIESEIAQKKQRTMFSFLKKK